MHRSIALQLPCIYFDPYKSTKEYFESYIINLYASFGKHTCKPMQVY